MTAICTFRHVKRNGWTLTPLMAAAKDGKKDFVEIFIGKGADVDYQMKVVIRQKSI